MNKHILYLAAGNSRRFGSNKLLYILDGKPLYRHGLDMLAALCGGRQDCSLTVVSQYEEILRQAESQHVRAVYSPDSPKGLSYTIRTALESLGEIPTEDFLVFVVADQPYLTARTVERLLDAAGPDVWTASVMCGERPGSPTLFSARLLPELLALQGDAGGRSVLRRHPCIEVQIEDVRELCDIDTPREVPDPNCDPE